MHFTGAVTFYLAQECSCRVRSGLELMLFFGFSAETSDIWPIANQHIPEAFVPNLSGGNFETLLVSMLQTVDLFIRSGQPPFDLGVA